MKRLLYLLLGIVFIACACQTETELTDADKDAIVQSVKQASEEYWSIWSSTYDDQTYSEFMKFYDINTDEMWQTEPVAVIINKNITYKQEESLAVAKSGFEERISTPTNIMKAHYSVLSDEKVLEVLEGDLTVIMKDSSVMGPLKFKMSNIWAKVDGEWKIQFLHNSF